MFHEEQVLEVSNKCCVCQSEWKLYFFHRFLNCEVDFVSLLVNMKQNEHLEEAKKSLTQWNSLSPWKR